MPKGKEVLDELRGRAEAAGAAHGAAQKEYAERQDAFTVAEALEEAITAVFERETHHALKAVSEALSSLPRWAQWRGVLAEVRLPDDSWLKGTCLMHPSVYREERELNGKVNLDLLSKALPLVEPQKGWKCGMPPLEVVDGRFCEGPFRELCVHFAS